MTMRIRAASAGCLAIQLACCIQSSVAQTTTTPSAHFGALLLPRDRPGYEFGIHLNRFTEFDKATEYVDGLERPIRYNQITKTFGFNLAAFAVTNHLPRSSKTLYRLTLQSGITSNEPTAFLQNELVHDLRDIPHVPIGDAPTQFDADFTAELTSWAGPIDGHQALIGAGVSVGTINQDAYLQTGAQSATVIVGEHRLAAVAGIVRVGIPAGGLSFKESFLADRYAMAQGSVSVTAFNQWTNGILPAADWGITYSTGFFVDEARHPIDELFWTVRFSWSDRFALETWNDSLNNTDRGPTFGVRMTAAFDSIPVLDRFFGMP